jgi:hypothetical protein
MPFTNHSYSSEYLPYGNEKEKGETMLTGPGWILVGFSKAEFSATPREVLHTGRGERIAILRVRKRKYIPRKAPMQNITST